MFGKRAVIITQCLGAGGKSAAKDIKDSLSWWGISSIGVLSFRLMSKIIRDRIPVKKRAKMENTLKKTALRLRSKALSCPARTRSSVKLKFFIVRMMQKGLGKERPWKSPRPSRIKKYLLRSYGRGNFFAVKNFIVLNIKHCALLSCIQRRERGRKKQIAPEIAYY